jgi:hypothetical protein
MTLAARKTSFLQESLGGSAPHLETKSTMHVFQITWRRYCTILKALSRVRDDYFFFSFSFKQSYTPWKLGELNHKELFYRRTKLLVLQNEM